MRTKRRPFTYANVIATLALFLALGGGVVLASSKLNGSQIKKNSEPGNRIKKNTLPNNRVKKASLKRDRFASGQLPGVAPTEWRDLRRLRDDRHAAEPWLHRRPRRQQQRGQQHGAVRAGDQLSRGRGLLRGDE